MAARVIADFITPAQAASMMGITRGTLANWRMEKKGPHYYRIGKREILYTSVDVKRWLRKHGRALH